MQNSRKACLLILHFFFSILPSLQIESFGVHSTTEEKKPGSTDRNTATSNFDFSTKLASDTTEQRFTMTINNIDYVTSENRPQALYDAFGNELVPSFDGTVTVPGHLSTDSFSVDSHNSVQDVSETVLETTKFYDQLTSSETLFDLESSGTVNGEMTFDSDFWELPTSHQSGQRLSTKTSDGHETNAMDTTVEDFSYRNAINNSTATVTMTTTEKANKVTTDAPQSLSGFQVLSQKKPPIVQQIFEDQTRQPATRLKTTVIPIDLLDDDLYDIYDYYDDLLLHDLHSDRATTIRGPDIFNEMISDSQSTVTQEENDSKNTQTFSEMAANDFSTGTDQTTGPHYGYPTTTWQKYKPQPSVSTVPRETMTISRPTLPSKSKYPPFSPTLPFESNFETKLSTTTPVTDAEATTDSYNAYFPKEATTVTVHEDSTESDPKQSTKTAIVTIDNHRPPSTATTEEPTPTDKGHTSELMAEKKPGDATFTTQMLTVAEDDSHASISKRPTIKYPFPTIHMEHTTKHPPYIIQDSNPTFSGSFDTHKEDVGHPETQSTFSDFTIFVSHSESTQLNTEVTPLGEREPTPHHTLPEKLPVPEKWAETFKPSTEDLTQTAVTDALPTVGVTSWKPAETTVTESVAVTSKRPSTTPPPPNPSTTVTASTTTEIDLASADYKEACGRPMPGPIGRIVGGGKSYFGEWPWVLSLRQWKKNTFLHKCGATLLNEFWAITAAHCVENVPLSDILLRLGEYDISHEQEPLPFVERRVQIVASHPKFDRRTFEYDLALLRFYEPVTFQKNILPACVPEGNNSYVGKYATVAGWGRLYEDGPLPDVIQEVALPVITNKLCESMYRQAGFVEDIPDIFICAGYADGGKDSCEGDSGGPMVIQEDDGRWVLAGVISWGIGCALPNQPGVYTRITKFAEWINQIIIF